MVLFATAALGQVSPRPSVDPSSASGSSAGAATPQATPQTLPASGSQSNLEQVVVTAQRRTETLQKAAVAVDVVKGSQLVASGVTSVDTLDKLVPSLTVENTGNGSLVFIRGVGNFTIQPNSDPATAFNFDGVYLGRPTSTEGVFYDLQRIEVLKGPQGTLYGRNATAGAINVLPVQPSTDRVSGYETTSFGNYGTVTTEGAVNIPVSDTAALRLAGTYDRHDGYLSDGTSSQDSGGFRAQFKDQITPDISIRLLGDYAHQGGTGAGNSYVEKYAFNPVTKQYVTTPYLGSSSDGVFNPAQQAFRQTVTAGTAGRTLGPETLYPFEDNSFYNIHGIIDWKTDIGTVSFLPAWFHADKHNQPIAGFIFGDLQGSDQYSFEARLISNPGHVVDYNLGAFYFNERIEDRQSASTQSVSTFTNSAYHTRSPAIYGRLTWHITDNLRVTGGIRYTEDVKSFHSQSQTLGILCVRPTGCPTAPLLPYTTFFSEQPYNPAASRLISPILGPILPVAPGTLAFQSTSAAIDSSNTDKITYRGAVEYDVAPRSLAYASIETGYRSGGFNTANGFPTYAPETITAYSIGSKNRFLDNRIQLNLEAFDWEYRNQQLSFFAVDTSGRPTVITSNIGQSTIRGFETEGQVLLTPETLFTADVQYLDSYYNSFNYQAASAAGFPFTGCSVGVASTIKYNVNCSGKQVFNSPKWTINAGVQQTFPLQTVDIVLSANTQFKSARFTSFDYVAAEHVGSTTQTDAQASLSPKNGAWAVSLFIHNLEDDRYQIFASTVPTDRLLSQIINQPRTYGARLSVKF